MSDRIYFSHLWAQAAVTIPSGSHCDVRTSATAVSVMLSKGQTTIVEEILSSIYRPHGFVVLDSSSLIQVHDHGLKTLI